MTPLARRVMFKVRDKSPATHEQWVQMLVDAELDEAVGSLITDGQWSDANNVRKLKPPETEPCE